MKKTLALMLCLLLLCALLPGCGGRSVPAETGETVVFKDSSGRSVTLPAEITRVAPSGAVATMFLASVCPEYMVCIASTPSSAQYKYLDPSLIKLPTTGQLYGSKSTINLESLMNAKPQVIIDLGDAKDGIARDMDALQKQTGIPVVFIESDLPHMAQAFRMLGSLLSGKTERCEALAAYVEETVALAETNAARIPEKERPSVMFTTGVSGLNTNAAGSTQAQVLELVGAKNAVVLEEVSNRGGGNPINLEQLYLFDPDVILFTLLTDAGMSFAEGDSIAFTCDDGPYGKYQGTYEDLSDRGVDADGDAVPTAFALTWDTGNLNETTVAAIAAGAKDTGNIRFVSGMTAAEAEGKNAAGMRMPNGVVSITVVGQPVVQPTRQNLKVDGEAKENEVYNISDYNYFKLRDIAALLNGTAAQFSVEFDAATHTVFVETGKAYTPVGGELTTGPDKSASCVLSNWTVQVNGEVKDIVAYNLEGNNFFKLQDLGDAIGFGVEYDKETDTMLITSE